MGPTRHAASLKTRQAHQLPEKKKGGGKAPACARLRERGREYHPDDAERHRDEKGEADDAANQHEPYQERVTDPERARASHSREKPHAMTTTNTITNVSMTYSFPATIKPEPFGPPQGIATDCAVLRLHGRISLLRGSVTSCAGGAIREWPLLSPPPLWSRSAFVAS